MNDFVCRPIFRQERCFPPEPARERATHIVRSDFRLANFAVRQHCLQRTRSATWAKGLVQLRRMASATATRMLEAWSICWFRGAREIFSKSWMVTRPAAPLPAKPQDQRRADPVRSCAPSCAETCNSRRPRAPAPATSHHRLHRGPGFDSKTFYALRGGGRRAGLLLVQTQALRFFRRQFDVTQNRAHRITFRELRRDVDNLAAAR